jgi:hypothetical protein
VKTANPEITAIVILDDGAITGGDRIFPEWKWYCGRLKTRRKTSNFEDGPVRCA